MASNSSLALHPRDVGVTRAHSAPARGAPRANVWRLLFNAVIAARQRQADQMVARYLASTGMKFTDSVEREIERRLLAGGGDNLR
jgi:hypothetical protein